MMHIKCGLLLLSAVMALISISPGVAAGIGSSGPCWALSTQDLVDNPPTATPATIASTVQYHVPTITCPTCPLRVEASIRKAPGILGVAINGQDETVTYDPSAVAPDAIKAAIEAGGDTAEPMGA